MITACLTGGIANNLFQVSAGYALAKKIGVEFVINYNISNAKSNLYNTKSYKRSLFKNIKETNYLDFNNYHQEGFSYKPLPLRDNLCLIGFFQSELFFDRYQNEIKKLINFPKSVKNKVDKKLKKIKRKKVGVHIRWGSYKNTPTLLPPMPKIYFDLAMRKFTDVEFILFTDDLETVNKEFDISVFKRLNNKTDIEDLYAMTQCDSMIMSNSSFSWWGSWLGIEKEKIIVPPIWFGIAGPTDIQDLIPKQWDILT